jgi:hypothetical protein
MTKSAPALTTGKIKTTLLATVGGVLLQTLVASGASAQEATTLHNPLINGAQSTQAGTAPTQGAIPPIGSGSTPTGVPAGMTGNGTLLPWVPNVPFNNIDLQNTQLTLPYDNTALTAPGALGPLLAPSIPAPPSTPGTDPGILQTVGGYATDAVLVPVNAAGGLPNGSAPTTRRGGQHTGDFGLTRTSGSVTTDFGQPLLQVPNLAQTPSTQQDGPRTITYDTNLEPTTTEYFTNPAAQASPGATDQTNGLLYGNRILFKGSGVYAQATQANY